MDSRMMPQTQAAIQAMGFSSSLKQPPVDLKPSQPQAIPVSPARHPYANAMAASPSRLRSSSPRLHSPASSEIFERNVQEPIPISTLGNEVSTDHMATHVITEDHIPPALEATANAITSEDLNPDEVEIVTSNAHQPAAASVLEGSASHADLTALHSPPALQPQHSEESELNRPAPAPLQSSAFPHTGDDRASNYGDIDPNDVRRLSFISFADVVQSEHQQAASDRESMHISSPLASNMSVPQDRAASPLRTPRSPGHSFSGGVTTPPPSVNVNSMAQGEQSPVRSVGVGSPASQHGELTIETMRQAVRKTASRDFGGSRSAGMSPVTDDASLRETRSRTNS